MTQTAAVFSSEQATSHTASEISPLTVSISAGTTAPLPVRTATNARTKPGEAAAIAGAAMNEGAFYTVISQLRYGDKVMLSFSVKDAYRAHFILIRGLLDFHRAPVYSFSFDRNEATFDVVTSAGALVVAELGIFLNTIAAWLDQELLFKKQLKKMIEFERFYRSQVARVYASREGYTLQPLQQ